jgi:hypothetical protein
MIHSIMRITSQDRQNLLSRLPSLKLSYETTHNKVSDDLYFLIPYGRKHLVWFTYFQDKKVCVFIEIGRNGLKNITKLEIIPQIFEKKLVLGTIFYGSLFTSDNKTVFSIENIHYYRGRNVENYTELKKLITIRDILSKELKQCSLTNKGIVIGLPVIETNLETAINTAKKMSYKIYSIQTRSYQTIHNSYNSILYKDYDTNIITKVFSVKADIQNDIYHLYVKNKYDELERHDIAMIPDYKTSVMMNKIFRKIKENQNLDALEESDDEDEFENTNEDKYVYLNKCVNMNCSFNSKFNKYVPISISSNNHRNNGYSNRNITRTDQVVRNLY